MDAKGVLWRAALLLASALTACGGSAPKTMLPPGQIIRLSDDILRMGGSDTVRFGRMHSGETVVKTLILHNTTQKPVVTTDYTRTCGCTTFEIDHQPIMPNEQRPVELRFDSQGLFGWQFKVIEVAIAGADIPLKIYIDAEVE